MTVFDLGKNISPYTSDLISGPTIFETLKDACEQNTDGPPLPFGLHVRVVEDPQERKILAFTIAMLTGFPTLFEGEDGGIYEVSMPKHDFLFPWPKP